MTDSIVLRGGTVLTMDDRHTVHQTGDVLVVGDRIEAVGPSLDVPDGTREIDASGGIVMPGMIDTHRHMWQTAMRGYGADWTLTQYFVWYYLEHGKTFRPEDIHAGNLLSAWESLEAGVTTTVDWSHGLQTVEHADAAVDALQATPGRFVLAYGNIQAGPWEWTADPAVRDFFERRRTGGGRHARLPARLRRDRRPDVPRAAGVRGGARAGPRGHDPRRGLGCDQRRRHQADPRERLRQAGEHLRPRGLAEHRLLPADRGVRRLGLGRRRSPSRAPVRAIPRPGRSAQYDIPVSLSMDTSVWWSGDLFSAMRSTLGADRSREHLEAHVKGDTVTALSLRAEHVVDWATRGGARALGRSDLGSLEAGKKADVVLLKNDDSPVSFPIVNPYGHVAFQAQRGDVHTVLVDGKVVKDAGTLVGFDRAAVRRGIDATIDHLRSAMGEETWEAGMHPALPEGGKMLDNPYQYTDFQSESTHGARGTMFGDPGSDS